MEKLMFGFGATRPMTLDISETFKRIGTLFVFDISRLMEFRSSRPEVLFKTGALKKFAKFTGK